MKENTSSYGNSPVKELINSNKFDTTKKSYLQNSNFSKNVSKE